VKSKAYREKTRNDPIRLEKENGQERKLLEACRGEEEWERHLVIKRWRKLVADPLRHEAYNAKRNEKLKIKETSCETRRKGKEKTCDDCGLCFLCIFYCAHWLCMNYIIAMPQLVNGISTHNHLLYFARFCAGSTPKQANKNIQQRTLSGFITIPLH